MNNGNSKMIEDRINKLEITMAEVSTDLKHIVSKLDTVVDKMEAFTLTRTEVSVLKDKVKSQDEVIYNLQQQQAANNKKLAFISGAAIAVLEVARQLFL